MTVYFLFSGWTVNSAHEYIFDLTLNLWNSLPDCECDAEAGLGSGSESDLEMSGFNSPNPGLPLCLHDRPIVTTDDEHQLPQTSTPVATTVEQDDEDEGENYEVCSRGAARGRGRGMVRGRGRGRGRGRRGGE